MAIVGIAVLMVVADADALGIGESGNYSKKTGCPSGGKSIDPVGVVFHGSKGHAAGAAGSGFDWGRRELAQKLFDGGHTSQQNQYWGNTANFKQCDGDYAGSAGTGVLIPNNHGH